VAAGAFEKAFASFPQQPCAWNAFFTSPHVCNFDVDALPAKAFEGLPQPHCALYCFFTSPHVWMFCVGEVEVLPLQGLAISALTVQMLLEGAAVRHALEAGIPNVLALVACKVGTSLFVSIAHVGVHPTGQALATAESAVWPASPRHPWYVFPPDTQVCKADSQAAGH
jgi:hypothetical protein